MLFASTTTRSPLDGSAATATLKPLGIQEARRRHVSLAAVVRDAVDRVVPDEDELRHDRVDSLLSVAGTAASGTGTVARDHDEVLAEGRL
jgi:hypothetical protein